jgi:hypothetical protein
MNELLKTAVAAWIAKGNEETFKAMVRTSYESIDQKPKFSHDCDQCLFFGHEYDQDLYICVNKHDWKRSKNHNLDSMLLRCGNSGPDYFSYHAPESVAWPPPGEWFETMKKNQPGYVELLNLAKQVGLYTGAYG